MSTELTLSSSGFSVDSHHSKLILKNHCPASFKPEVKNSPMCLPFLEITPIVWKGTFFISSFIISKSGEIVASTVKSLPNKSSG